jgi:hypothetical protein
MAFSTVQQMLAMAWIADLDAGPMNGTVCENTARLLPRIKDGLLALNFVAGTDYHLVWGPAVFTFNFGGLAQTYSDNTLFVVQSKLHPSRFVVATAGTDSVSVADWYLEDFWTGTTVPWPYGTATTNPRISVSSLLGLIICQTLIPCAGIPGAGEALKPFLAKQVAAAKSPLTITTTGHSLGGSLSPLMALWLKDTQGTTGVNSREVWDPNSASTLIAYSYAGATSGDANWAAHFDSQFDAQHGFRVWNQYDVVPHAWEVKMIAETPTLYSPTPDPSIQKIADSAIQQVGDLNYQHWHADTPPLTPPLIDTMGSYWVKAAYQHSIGFWVGLGMPTIPDFLKSAIDGVGKDIEKGIEGMEKEIQK